MSTLALGRLVKEYKKSSAQVVKVIIASLFSGAIALIFFAAAFFSRMTLVERIGLSIPGLLFLLPVVAGVYMLFRGRGASLRLYENGLLYLRGGKQFMTTWDEIDSYVQETACRITKKDGEVIEFGLNLKDADEVAAKIQEETSKRMLPQMKAAILNGSSVQFRGLKPSGKIPFGKALDNFARAFSGFSVDAGGITEIDGASRIAWKAVTDFGITEEEVGVGAGRQTIDLFFVQDANTTLKTRLGLLSNAHVLLALCDEMVARKQAAANGAP